MKVSMQNLVIKPVNERLADLSKILKNVRTGDTLKARVLRIVDKSAILEIMGVRVRADFPAGLPSKGDILSLVLKARSGAGFIFSMASVSKEGGIPDQIRDLISSNGNSSIHEIVRFIRTTAPGIFELNLFLMGSIKDLDKIKKKSEMFMELYKRGLSSQAILRMSSFSAGYAQSLIMDIMKKLFMVDSFSYNNEDVDDEIADFFKNKNEDLLKNYLELAGADGDDSESGIFYLGDSDSVPVTARYSMGGDSAIVDVTFSGLGKVSIHFLKLRENMRIIFYLENEEAENVLRNRSDFLIQNLEAMGIDKCSLSYNNYQKILDIINDWSTDFYIKRDFDIKV